MDPAGGRLHQGRERVDIGALELCVFAVLQQLCGKRMQWSKLLEYLRIGAGAGLRAFHHRQLELVKQHRADLKR